MTDEPRRLLAVPATPEPDRIKLAGPAPVVIPVDEAAGGRLSIVQGERKYSFANRELAASVLRVLRREV
jgi:hypothetical protein